MYVLGEIGILIGWQQYWETPIPYFISLWNLTAMTACASSDNVKIIHWKSKKKKQHDKTLNFMVLP